MATSNKYDRQLRLWGANGQKALSETCIILINASAAGTESLKNLVLPGIGSFHIIDDQVVNSDDYSNNSAFGNFFVFPSSEKEEEEVEGKSRAEIATKHLLELNPDVKGSFTSIPSLKDADYQSIFRSICESNKDANFLVVAADLSPDILKPVSNLCWNGINGNGTGTGTGTSSTIPMVIVKSYGLIGTVRLQTPLHTIVESKPDNFVPDLRLSSVATAFPELHEFMKSIDLTSLENHVHGHIPFVIILCKAMDKWLLESKSSDNLPPKTFAEKQEFKKMIQSMSRNYDMELNFQEAVTNASLVYTTLDIPCEVEELLENAEEHLRDETYALTSFDVLLVALKRFMKDNNGYPPLNGSIPDMTASTSYYIDLQNVYKTKAQKDEEQMKNIIASIVEECGNASSMPSVSDEELCTFCKNVYNLRITRTRSYTSEYDFVYDSEAQKEEIQGELVSETFDPYSVPAQTPFLWHIALRAADAFHDEWGHYPGKDSKALSLESDAKAVQEKLKEIVSKMNLQDNELIASTIFSKDEELEEAFAKEITRYYNAEIHNISSVVGGVASQEAVKLITKQYVPMNGTYVYNGIAGVAGVYQF